ncbi:MAG: nicotinate phosphoribosyltransferase [Desulfovibrionaceae bacterium]
MHAALPADHRPYADTYFLRAAHILRADGVNPRVTMQVFIRQGPGRAWGITAAVDALERFSSLADHGGQVLAVPEGHAYAPCEPLLHITGPLLDFIELETLYLGLMSAATTLGNAEPAPNPAAVTRRVAALRALTPDKRILYFGARHWSWDMDEVLSCAAVAGGADACATDAGAQAAGLRGGVGTIPHALVLAYGSTLAATQAFDRHIDPGVPRIALVDTFGREIDDALAVASALGPRLAGVRLDTAGEHVGQGGTPGPFDPAFQTGPGVTVSLVRAMRRALDEAGFGHVGITLSSGFGDPRKVRAFVKAEKTHGRLFDAMGIGGLFEARFATADIVMVEGKPCAKVGRSHAPNPAMRRVL